MSECGAGVRVDDRAWVDSHLTVAGLDAISDG